MEEKEAKRANAESTASIINETHKDASHSSESERRTKKRKGQASDSQIAEETALEPPTDFAAIQPVPPLLESKKRKRKGRNGSGKISPHFNKGTAEQGHAVTPKISKDAGHTDSPENKQKLHTREAPFPGDQLPQCPGVEEKDHTAHSEGPPAQLESESPATSVEAIVECVHTEETNSVARIKQTTTPVANAVQELDDEVQSAAQNRAEEDLGTSALSEVGDVTPRKKQATTRKKTGTSSHYFSPSPSPVKKKERASRAGIPIVPSAPLGSLRYGLFQEVVADDPWKVIIGCIFVTRTRGAVAVPEFWSFLSRYPTAEAVATSCQDTLKHELDSVFARLGFGQRTSTILQLSKTYVETPPQKGKRYRTKDYPHKGAHAIPSSSRVAADEVVPDDADDPRIAALEIAHLNGAGPYAYDSFRIFCRDVLRGVASDWDRGGVTDPTFMPEWQRVLPGDKELREFLRWMWLKEGFEWDPVTGERTAASVELQREAIERPRKTIRETEWLDKYWKEVELEEERVAVEKGKEWEEGWRRRGGCGVDRGK